MIRVNLLRTSGLGGNVVASPVAGDDHFGNREVAISIGKILVMLTLPLCLYAWESISLSDLNDKAAALNAEFTKLQADKQKFGNTGPRVERFTKEKAKVDHQTLLIRSIAKDRLREVKALDALQSLIPPRTWLKKLSIEKNLMKMQGYSTAEDGVSELMRQLEASVYFSGVEPKETSSENLAGVQVKKFNLELHLGKNDKVEL